MKVAIDNDTGTTMVKGRIKLVLMAELTWAKLYTKAMRKDLGAISTAVGKKGSTTARLEMTKSAEKLHDQLQSANRTVGELSDCAGIRPVAIVNK
ncbi:MAG TPA: hypothetical protein VNE82_03725 [Candidatus Binataceae bacterium]|nr:hypothetical protein [Candidatus Binataceae bacterium]